MIGWLIETACVLNGGHSWDRSRICTDLCMRCGKIVFISAQESELRFRALYMPRLEQCLDEIRSLFRVSKQTSS